MRLAVWITRAGSILDAAIVAGKGPALLRRMLDEQIVGADASERPTRITVWPSVGAAFRDVAFPAVEVEKDEFLKVVVEDHCCFGHIPHGLPVRGLG